MLEALFCWLRVGLLRIYFFEQNQYNNLGANRLIVCSNAIFQTLKRSLHCVNLYAINTSYNLNNFFMHISPTSFSVLLIQREVVLGTRLTFRQNMSITEWIKNMSKVFKITPKQSAPEHCPGVIFLTLNRLCSFS